MLMLLMKYLLSFVTSRDKKLLKGSHSFYSLKIPESCQFAVYSNLDMLETKKFDKYLGFPLKFSDRS